jgi:hypothetical protein
MVYRIPFQPAPQKDYLGWTSEIWSLPLTNEALKAVVKADLSFNKALKPLAKTWYATVKGEYPGEVGWVFYRLIADLVQGVYTPGTLSQGVRDWVSLAYHLCEKEGMDLLGPLFPETGVDLDTEILEFSQWTKEVWGEAVCEEFENSLRDAGRYVPDVYLPKDSSKTWVAVQRLYQKVAKDPGFRARYLENWEASRAVLNLCG